VLLDFHRELLQLRKNIPTLANLSKDDMEVSDYEKKKVLVVKRWSSSDEAVIVFHFGESSITITIPFLEDRWRKRMDSAEERWHGPGSHIPHELGSQGEVIISVQPHAFVLFVRERER
jgi:maltooligosyltrehalose trehalohydrolase